MTMFPKLLLVALCLIGVHASADFTPLIVAHRGVLRHASENTLADRAVLLETLRDVEADLPTGIRFGQLIVPRTTIREFTKYLEEEA